MREEKRKEYEDLVKLCGSEGLHGGDGAIDPRNADVIDSHLAWNMSVEDVVKNVKERVVGQDDAVHALAGFLTSAMQRVQMVRAGFCPDDLPRMSSLLVLGTTASGKSFTLRTLAKAMGISLHVVDTSSLTGTGWRGNSIDDFLIKVARETKRNPAAVQMVMFDEFDKRNNTNDKGDGFVPQAEFLQLLDGGVHHGCSNSNEREEFDLNTDAVIFAFAGAFTGIEKIVRKRLAKQGRAALGFGAGSDVVSSDVEELRRQVCIEDLVDWGVPRELLGRFGLMVNLPALSADSLHLIVKGSEYSLENRFTNLLIPQGASFTVDNDAAGFLVQRALDNAVGARSLETELMPLFCSAQAHCRTHPDVQNAIVTVGDTGKELEVRYV